MKIAAIDIGSNAARLQITKILSYNDQITFKRLEYVRFPLQLGLDVFSIGKISEDRRRTFGLLMRTFKNLIDLHEVDHHYACATSAMREAENAEAVLAEVRNQTELNVNIISGQQEAELINEVIRLNLDDKTYLHIDVGGGSTELNLYVRRSKLFARSFGVGSSRKLSFTQHTNAWQEIINWLSKNIQKNYGRVTAVGTGGNINKLYSLAQVPDGRKMPLKTLVKVRNMLASQTVGERLLKMQLNPDRAEVIVPAADIYMEIMGLANCRHILVPDIGLKDGINFFLYEKYYPAKGEVVIHNQW